MCKYVDEKNYKKLDLQERADCLIEGLFKNDPQLFDHYTSSFFNQKSFETELEQINKFIPVMEESLKLTANKTSFWYSVRNWTLGLGFISILLSKLIMIRF